jgi:catechol 2,3-dioxygenase-like lactoylglutathione lyase family enzyme
MIFSGACLITRDIGRLRDFYRSALDVEPDGDEGFVEFGVAGAHFTLFDWQGMEQMAPGCMQNAGHGGCALEFEVADVDSRHVRLMTMGVPIVKPPATHPWGRRSVWFRDPDGNIVSFHQPAPASTEGSV